MKILSIDFDTIMFPCIKLYNEYCAGNENDTQIWRQIEFERDISQYLRYDANVYQDIVNIIFKNLKNGAQLIPIKEHQMLVDYLIKHEMMDLTFDITNIDYHHDIAYQQDSFIQMDFDKYSCADWAGYLMLKNKDTSLRWIRCPGSSLYNPALKEFPNQITIERIDTIKDLKDDYDLIFFCLSPQWVPYIYHHLYDLVINLAKLVYPSSFEEKSAPILIQEPVAVPVLVTVPVEATEEIIEAVVENSNEEQMEEIE